MAESNPSGEVVDAPSNGAVPALPLADVAEISPKQFEESFGTSLKETLDLRHWDVGHDLEREYTRIQREVAEAVEQEDAMQIRIREEIFPLLCSPAGSVPEGGVYQADMATIESIHRGLLFDGGVEACDGTHSAHDTLPLTIHQIGVSLVSYQGKEGTWCQRLFRRDLRVQGSDPVDEVAELLRRRSRRTGLNQSSQRDAISEMARRAIMAYAERAILLEKSSATWRMGHGNPAPWELLTGAGSMDLMIMAIKVLRRLIEGHKKFVFVASEPADRVLLTIGQALRPCEYAIVKTLDEGMEKMVEGGHFRMNTTVDNTWDGEPLKPTDWIKRFRDRVASQVVVGVYRATRVAPAQVFYAHKDHAHYAAHVVLADSVLQEHRGFPLLIDLADHVCSAVVGGNAMGGLLASAYAEAKAPWRYLSERTTRSR